jgi:hypothetical protein
MSDSTRTGFTLVTLVLALLAAGVAAVLALTFLTSPLDEGGTQLLRLFTPWIERLAALSWVYTACGTGLLIFTVLGVLASLGARRRHSRTAARAV